MRGQGVELPTVKVSFWPGVHTRENESLNQELVINLHSYVDILFSKVIEIINNSPYEDSISDALTGHKLAVQIMDEKLDKQQDEYITPENALRYFYYDFEK